MKKLFFIFFLFFLFSCENLTTAPDNLWVISPSDNNVVSLDLEAAADDSYLTAKTFLTNGEEIISNVDISIGDASIAYVNEAGVIVPVAIGSTTIVVTSREHQGHSSNGVGLEYVAVNGTIIVQ